MVIQQSGDYEVWKKKDYCLWKPELDVEFLVRCREKKVIPKSLNFQLTNKSLRSSLIYAQCQSNLLLEEIRQKKSRVLRKEFDNLRSFLQQKINSIFVQNFRTTTTLNSNQIVSSNKRSFITF